MNYVLKLLAAFLGSVRNRLVYRVPVSQTPTVTERNPHGINEILDGQMSTPLRAWTLTSHRDLKTGTLAVPATAVAGVARRSLVLALLLVVAWLAVLPDHAAAQTPTTLVSNLGQPHSDDIIVGGAGSGSIVFSSAQQFTTGSNADGYTLTAVTFVMTAAVNWPEVSIYSSDSDGAPDTLLYTLSSPASSVPRGEATFTAPGVALSADTTYLVVMRRNESASATFAISLTRSTAEDAGALAGWSIHDKRHRRNHDTAAWREALGVLRIGLTGYAGAPAAVASTDATLSALSVENASDNSAITLSPAFRPLTTNYRALVWRGVDRITVAPTTRDSNAAFAILDASNTAIADANTTQSGHQVPLRVGSNTIKVRVTAEDGATTRTYTVTVTRSTHVQPTISIADATATVSDHYIKFDVTLDRPLDKGVEFHYRVTSGSAHDSSIELQQAFRFTFAHIYPGELDQQIFIPLKEDVAVGNTVNVKIFAATANLAPVHIGDATARGTIGAAPVSRSQVTTYNIGTKPSATAHEPSSSYASALHFSVHLTPSARTLGEFVCYKYETIDEGADAGTATPGDEIVSNGRFTHSPANADYRKTSGRGFFRPDVGSGASSWDSFSVIIFDDDVDDDRETVNVKISEAHICGDASRWVHIFRDTARGTIRNSDPIPARSFSVRDAEAVEGADASLDFAVALGKAQTEAVTVDYATSDGTATAGTDYTAQSGTLTFSPGETAKTISVPIANDSVDDDRETVTLTLSNPSTGAAIHDGEAVGKINDYLRTEIWYSTMSPDLVYNEFGYSDIQGNRSGSLTSKSFVVDGEAYTVKLTEAADWIYIGFDKELPVGFMLTVDDVELQSSDATFSSFSYAEVYRWNAQDIYWDSGGDVGLAMFRKDLPTTAEAESVGPAITGTAQVGETLTAHTSGIFDDDGLDDVSYSYRWIRNDGTDDSDISGATSSTYTLTDDDEGQTIKVKVSFTDDADNDEERTSAATGTVAARPNRAATGAPTISGTPTVGQTLTADTSGIADADGLDDVSYSYQWIANDGTSDTEIEGATGSTFFVLAAYEDQTIKLRVSFTDDAGNAESLTSAATDAVTLSAQAQQSDNQATGAPTISGTAQVGQTLTASTSGISDGDGLDDVSYSYQWIRNDGTNDSDISGATSSTYALVDADEGKTIKVKVSFTDDAGNDESLTSAATGTVAARPNRAATGAPTITGTAQVGQTLTVGTSGISDADGLTNVSYSYQWISNDGSSDTDITGATSSSYTLVSADEGKTIKATVTFTDDRDNEESLTSAATGEVAAAPIPLTVRLENEPSSHNGVARFTFQIRFSEEFPLSFRTLRDHAFTVSGGEVKKAKRLEKGSNIGWKITVKPDSNDDVEIVLPITTDCSTSSAICTEDSRKLSNKVEFTVAGP